MHTVISEKTVFNDRLVLEEGKIADVAGNEFSRLRLKRGDASAVLLYNTDSKKIILTRQFRYPIHGQTEEEILEILAGKIEKGKDSLHTAMREA